MAKIIVRILCLEPPFPDVESPDHTLYIDATAADNLGITELLMTGEIDNITFIVGKKSSLMNGVLHSLEYPYGNIIRLTDKALKYFKLRSGDRYWVEWDNETKTLTVLKKVKAK